MNYYREDQLGQFHNENFSFIEIVELNEVFEITLNRTAKKNAIHPQMLNELAFALQYAQNSKKVRALVLRAKGDVFCSETRLLHLGIPLKPSTILVFSIAFGISRSCTTLSTSIMKGIRN